MNKITKTLLALLVCIVLACSFTACASKGYVNDEIEPINGQITAINSSVTALQAVDTELDGYIDTLEATVDTLKNNLAATGAALDLLKDKVEAEHKNGDDAEAHATISQLEAAKADIEAEIAAISTTIEALKAKDTELEGKITALESYVTTELASAEDWAYATFTTLEQYSAIQTDVATVKELIASNSESITALEAKLNEKLEGTVNEIATAYTEAIATAKSQIKSDYERTILGAISNSEASMKAWVNETLAEGYYNIAEIDAKVAALETKIAEGDSVVQAQLDAQKAALDQAKIDLTAAYRTAITEAIETNNGILRGEISTAITEVNAKIEVINTTIAALHTQVNNIANRVQSLVYLPDSADRIVRIDHDTKLTTMQFLVSPEALAPAVEPDSISVYVRYVGSSDAVELNVSAVTTQTGLITVVIDDEEVLSDDFWRNNVDAFIYVALDDGNTDIFSETVQLEGTNFIEPTVDIGDITIDGVTFKKGDAIGVFVTSINNFSATADKYNGVNMKYVYNGGEWILADGYDTVYYEGVDKQKISAYYPYLNDYTNADSPWSGLDGDEPSAHFFLDAAQSINGTDASEFYWFSGDLEDNAVNTELTSAFTKVTVNVKGLSDDVTVTSVTIDDSVYMKAHLSFAEKLVSNHNDSALVDVTMYESAMNTYQAVVVPQTVQASAFKLVITTLDGNTYTYIPTEDVVFESGEEYNIDVDISTLTPIITYDILKSLIESADGTAEDPTKITLNADLALEKQLSIPDGKHVWIDGDGYTITPSASYNLTVSHNASLKLTNVTVDGNNSGNGPVIYVGISSSNITTPATVTLGEGFKLTNCTRNSNVFASTYGVYVNSYGVLILEDGAEITGNNKVNARENLCAICVLENATLKIKGGKVTDNGGIGIFIHGGTAAADDTATALVTVENALSETTKIDGVAIENFCDESVTTVINETVITSGDSYLLTEADLAKFTFGAVYVGGSTVTDKFEFYLDEAAGAIKIKLIAPAIDAATEVVGGADVTAATPITEAGTYATTVAAGSQVYFTIGYVDTAYGVTVTVMTEGGATYSLSVGPGGAVENIGPGNYFTATVDEITSAVYYTVKNTTDAELTVEFTVILETVTEE